MTAVRYVPKGTRYTHPDVLGRSDELHIAQFRAETRARLDEAARNADRTEPPEIPRKTCPMCKGTGVESWTGPDAGSCSGCGGLGDVAMGERDIRRVYRELRGRMCEKLGTTTGAFDALVGRGLGEGATPAEWLRAAQGVARKARR